MIPFIIIAVLAAIIVGLIAYRFGFQKGFISTSVAYNQLLDSSLQRFRKIKQAEQTDPTDTDEQQE